MEEPTKSNVRNLVPEWEHDDFLTNAPLEWLYAFHNDPVKQRQMLVLVSEKAASVGIKTFRGMWTDYLKQLRATREDPEDHVTQFENQPIELSCGLYTCSDLGIFGVNNFGAVDVCAHPIMPVRRLINIDTGEVKQEIAFRRGKRWRTVIFDKQTLSSAQKIVGLSSYGIGIDSENAKDMVRYLSAMENLNYDQLPEASSVGRLGWVDGYGFSPYVDNLVFDGNDSYRHMFECVRTHGKESEWMALAKEVRAGKSIAARVMLAASFASVLVKPMDALPFMVHVWGGAGAGKAQPLDTRVITPNGHKLMGDIQIGDQVIGGDGKAHTVTGVFPQGAKQVYKITFADGRATRCCAEHLWNVTTRTRRDHGRGYTTMTLAEMMQRPVKLAGKHGYTYQIPTTKPVEYAPGDTLPVDPYLLGALIGDGCLTLTRNPANGCRTLYFNNSEDDVIQRVSNELERNKSQMKANSHTANQFVITECAWLKEAIISMGLNHRSEGKFIPEIYMTASVRDRIDLLRGLMDTDGSVAQNGSLSYSTTSKRLADDVQTIARGLGYRAAVSVSKRNEYTVTISANDTVFSSEKHKRRMECAKSGTYREVCTDTLAIVSIEKDGVEPCQCIMVDSEEHTYLCDDFIVTHNTVGLMLAASVWAAPSVGDYCKSFNGTDVAGELQAAFCGNLPLCLDELQVIKERKDFDRLIYMLCEGVGRNRGAKAGGLQRTPSWRNCTISTGEQPITNGNSGAGAVNRVLEIDCKEEQLFSNPREAVAILTRNFGHAGKKFVAALSNDGCMDSARSIQQAVLEQLTGKATDKQTLAASLVLTADALAEMLLFDDGHTLTVAEILPFLTTNVMADANRRAYNWLMDTIASNPGRFQTNNFNEYVGECWGAVSEQEGRAYIIKSVFDRLMNDAGYSSESFLSWAKRNGIIKQTGRHNTLMKRLKGIACPVRCVAISIAQDDDGGTIVDAEPM